MSADRIIIAVHGAAVLLALAAALVWPRAGQAALMVPFGGSDIATVLRWADAEQAPLLSLDPGSGRVIARISTNRSLLSAISHGIVPIAVRGTGCTARPQGTRTSWTN
jgi:hypothetical protein